jgi:transposase
LPSALCGLVLHSPRGKARSRRQEPRQPYRSLDVGGESTACRNARRSYQPDQGHSQDVWHRAIEANRRAFRTTCGRGVQRCRQRTRSHRSVAARGLFLKDQIRHLDRQLIDRARQSAVCQRLMTIPGVGVLTALAFVTGVDDPSKFPKSRSVGAYFGLTPRCYQSGEIDQNRGISKATAKRRSRGPVPG